jgi:hypothetical protein
LLAENGFTQVDYLSIRDGVTTGSRRVPFSEGFPDRSLAAPTINMMLAEWDHIYWVSNSLLRNISYAVEITLDFFNKGGTMFINIPTTNQVNDDDEIFQFLPIVGFEKVPQGSLGFIIPRNSLLVPDASLSNPPTLKLRNDDITTRPLIPFNETQFLFEADFRVRPLFGTPQPFTGSNLIAATNPDNSIIYFSIDINNFTNDSDLARLIELTCNEILGFQP